MPALIAAGCSFSIISACYCYFLDNDLLSKEVSTSKGFLLQFIKHSYQQMKVKLNAITENNLNPELR